MKRHSTRPVFDVNMFFPPHIATTYRTKWSMARCILRLFFFVLWGVFIFFTQGALSFFPGRARVIYPTFFWKITCKIMGIEVRSLGENIGTYHSPKEIKNGARPVVYVSNHSSWIDILVLGKLLQANFVAKTQVKQWPLIGPLSRVARSIFITRSRQGTGDEVKEVIKRLHQGDNIVFFPEGTTSDGNQVLPFFSTIFAITKPTLRKKNTNPTPPALLVQPISVVYDRIENLPVGRQRRLSVFSWFGDMDMSPHLLSFGQWRSVRATILFHPPLNPEDFLSRKELCQASYEIVKKGHEDLRQNRL